jgi:Transglutaminase-like domain
MNAPFDPRSASPRRRRVFPSPAARAVAVTLAGALAFAPLRALTLDELSNDPKMSPKRFATFFENFHFETHVFDVQSPRQFLASRRGTCIDYAALADHVLRQKGFTTRLVRVELVGKSTGHAVCYVEENRAYLDYNNRKYVMKLERSGPTLREIASSVADSFDANWTFAQEFTFSYQTFEKRARYTVVKTQPPATDPDRARPASPRATPAA